MFGRGFWIWYCIFNFVFNFIEFFNKEIYGRICVYIDNVVCFNIFDGCFGYGLFFCVLIYGYFLIYCVCKCNL